MSEQWLCPQQKQSEFKFQQKQHKMADINNMTEVQSFEQDTI